MLSRRVQQEVWVTHSDKEDDNSVNYSPNYWCSTFPWTRNNLIYHTAQCLWHFLTKRSSREVCARSRYLNQMLKSDAGSPKIDATTSLCSLHRKRNSHKEGEKTTSSSHFPFTTAPSRNFEFFSFSTLSSNFDLNFHLVFWEWEWGSGSG